MEQKDIVFEEVKGTGFIKYFYVLQKCLNSLVSKLT